MADLRLTGVTKYFGSVPAVNDLSLTINSGELMSLLGPSGCGKSTTLNMIAGFLRPEHGSIFIGSRPVENVPPHRRNTGMVFQNYALFPHLTVFGNLAFGLEMRHVSRDEIRTRVRRALDMVRLSKFEDRFPKQISGGQQQRVALARALVIEPEVLLLDEPLSNLDANLREEMRFEIRSIQQRVGITTIFVTHDRQEAMAISDRLAVMNQGSAEQVGTPTEIYSMPDAVFVARFIGQANILACNVGEVDSTGATAILRSGHTVKAARAKGARSGERASLVIQPERIRLSSSPIDGMNSIPARIERAAFLGAITNVGLRIADETITVLATTLPDSLTPGEEIHLNWQPEECAILGKE